MRRLTQGKVVDARKQMAAIHQSWENIVNGVRFPESYSKLALSIPELERLGLDDSVEVRQSLAYGIHALGLASRQLALDPKVSAAHFLRSSQLALSYRDYDLASRTILGQALTLQQVLPLEASRILENARELVLTKADDDQRLSWLQRTVAVMRLFGQYDDAIRVHRIHLNPMSRTLGRDPFEIYIRDTAWAAVLIEHGRKLDEAYDALTGTQPPVPSPAALFDRHLQFVELYRSSSDLTLAEHHLYAAMEICQTNGYSPIRVISARKSLFRST